MFLFIIGLVSELLLKKKKMLAVPNCSEHRISKSEKCGGSLEQPRGGGGDPRGDHALATCVHSRAQQCGVRGRDR
jgi:hypothetical protein